MDRSYLSCVWGSWYEFWLFSPLVTMKLSFSFSVGIINIKQALSQILLCRQYFQSALSNPKQYLYLVAILKMPKRRFPTTSNHYSLILLGKVLKSHQEMKWNAWESSLFQKGAYILDKMQYHSNPSCIL